jgi:hypothetical protein
MDTNLFDALLGLLLLGSDPNNDSDDGSTTRISNDINATPTSDNGRSTPTSDDGGSTPTSDDDGLTPTSDDGGSTPTSDNGGSKPTSNDKLGAAAVLPRHRRRRATTIALLPHCPPPSPCLVRRLGRSGMGISGRGIRVYQ